MGRSMILGVKGTRYYMFSLSIFAGALIVLRAFGMFMMLLLVLSPEQEP
jgi:hypothetical protein